MIKDSWHYPRTELAQRLLGVLDSGAAKAVTIFAPRRTGKSEFLLKDLGPLAERKGHRVVYISFWQAQLAPVATLLYALEKSLEGGSLIDRIMRMAQRVAPKLALSAPLPGGTAKVEIDLTALGTKPPPDILLYLDDLLGRVGAGRKPAILMFDEVQELARDKANAGLIATLRTSLDTRSEQLRAVFTGSSQQGLRAMFDHRSAPFFHFATQMAFPALDVSFADHCLEQFHRASGRHLDRQAALSAFEVLERMPETFRQLLNELILRPDLELESALEHLRLQLAERRGFPQAWLSFKPVQRAVVHALAMGVRKPYAEASLRAMAAQMDGTVPTTRQVQAALRKLHKDGVVDKLSDQWVLADPEFATWIRNGA
jgi:hypothetical protein